MVLPLLIQMNRSLGIFRLQSVLSTLTYRLTIYQRIRKCLFVARYLNNSFFDNMDASRPSMSSLSKIVAPPSFRLFLPTPRGHNLPLEPSVDLSRLKYKALLLKGPIHPCFLQPRMHLEILKNYIFLVKI